MSTVERVECVDCCKLADAGEVRCTYHQYRPANHVYTICYIDECGTEHEQDHEFPNKEYAIGFCHGVFKGREGLVSGITMTGSDGTDEDGSTMGIF